MRLLGVEIVVIAALWVVRTVRVTKALSAAMRSLDRPYVDYRIEWIAWIIWVVALVAAGLSLTAESGVGFSFLALAMAGMFGFAIWSAWVLISEISE